MATTFYARVRIQGTSTPQMIQVEAGGSNEARRLIEARLGKVQTWLNAPQGRAKSQGPPSWYK